MIRIWKKFLFYLFFKSPVFSLTCESIVILHIVLFIYPFRGSTMFPVGSRCSPCASCYNVRRSTFQVHGNRTISDTGIGTYYETPPCTLRSTSRFSETFEFIITKHLNARILQNCKDKVKKLMKLMKLIYLLLNSVYKIMTMCSNWIECAVHSIAWFVSRIVSRIVLNIIVLP